MTYIGAAVTAAAAGAKGLAALTKRLHGKTHHGCTEGKGNRRMEDGGSRMAPGVLPHPPSSILHPRIPLRASVVNCAEGSRITAGLRRVGGSLGRARG